MSPHLPAMKPALDLEAVTLGPLAASHLGRICPLASPEDHPIFTRQRMAEAFNDRHTFGLLAMLSPRHPVGFLLVRRAASVMLIEALAVVHEYRRCGLGRMLVQTLVNMHGTDRQLVAYVPLGNLSACRFFAADGLRFRSSLIAGAFRDDDAVVFRRMPEVCSQGEDVP